MSYFTWAIIASVLLPKGGTGKLTSYRNPGELVQFNNYYYDDNGVVTWWYIAMSMTCFSVKQTRKEGEER